MQGCVQKRVFEFIKSLFSMHAFVQMYVDTFCFDEKDLQLYIFLLCNSVKYGKILFTETEAKRWRDLIKPLQSK